MENWEQFEPRLIRWQQRTSQGWWLRHTAQAPIFRLLWSLKIPVRPIYYCHPVLLALSGAVYFFVVTYLLLMLTDAEVDSRLHLIGSALFGILVVVTTRVERRMRKLPDWEDI